LNRLVVQCEGVDGFAALGLPPPERIAPGGYLTVELWRPVSGRVRKSIPLKSTSLQSHFERLGVACEEPWVYGMDARELRERGYDGDLPPPGQWLLVLQTEAGAIVPLYRLLPRENGATPPARAPMAGCPKAPGGAPGPSAHSYARRCLPRAILPPE